MVGAWNGHVSWHSHVDIIEDGKETIDSEQVPPHLLLLQIAERCKEYSSQPITQRLVEPPPSFNLKLHEELSLPLVPILHQLESYAMDAKHCLSSRMTLFTTRSNFSHITQAQGRGLPSSSKANGISCLGKRDNSLDEDLLSLVNFTRIVLPLRSNVSFCDEVHDPKISACETKMCPCSVAPTTSRCEGVQIKVGSTADEKQEKNKKTMRHSSSHLMWNIKCKEFSRRLQFVLQVEEMVYDALLLFAYRLPKRNSLWVVVQDLLLNPGDVPEFSIKATALKMLREVFEARGLSRFERFLYHFG